MLATPNHDDLNLTLRTGHLSGLTIKAVAIFCGEGSDEDSTTVTAYLSPEVVSVAFRHAIELERAYGESLLDFDEVAPPDYGNSISIDLVRLAAEIRVARIYCLVAACGDSAVTGVRNYGGVEVTVLEAIVTQLTRFQELWNSQADTTMTIHRLQ